MQRAGHTRIYLRELGSPHGLFVLKRLLRFFRSSEKFTPNVLYPDVNIEERGLSGLWQTGYSYCTEICKRSLAAMIEIGIAYNPCVISILQLRLRRNVFISPRDVNTPRGTLGATKMATFIDPNGKRSSTATAYLSEDVVARKNLTVAIKTMVCAIYLFIFRISTSETETDSVCRQHAFCFLRMPYPAPWVLK